MPFKPDCDPSQEAHFLSARPSDAASDCRCKGTEHENLRTLQPPSHPVLFVLRPASRRLIPVPCRMSGIKSVTAPSLKLKYCCGNRAACRLRLRPAEFHRVRQEHGEHGPRLEHGWNSRRRFGSRYNRSWRRFQTRIVPAGVIRSDRAATRSPLFRADTSGTVK